MARANGVVNLTFWTKLADVAAQYLKKGYESLYRRENENTNF